MLFYEQFDIKIKNNLKNVFKNIDYKRIASHALFWLLLNLVVDIASSIARSDDFLHMFIVDLIFYTPTDMLALYVTIYYLFPKFLLKKKYVSFFLLLTVLFIAILCIATPVQYIPFLEFSAPKYIAKGHEVPNFIQYAKYTLASTITLKLSILGFGSAIKFFKIWFSGQKRQQKLEKEKLEIALQLREAELKFLKNQINPHFLFNALNNLYSLTLEKSDKAPDIVLRLSGLLDYMLYECNDDIVFLYKEIKAIKNYVDLQKIRYGNQVNVEIKVSDNIENTMIAPLLLMPFVENAFKHGLTKNMGKGNIFININVLNSEIHFNIKNTVNCDINKEKRKGGIGMENIKKRLELQYKNSYSLNINKIKNNFSVELIIRNKKK